MTTITDVTLDTLEGVLARKRDVPIEVILVDENWDRARALFARVAHRQRVQQTWMTNGTRRAVLENGNVIRLASAASRGGLRGHSADIVVLTTGAFAIGSTLDDARLVVASKPTGWVAVL